MTYRIVPDEVSHEVIEALEQLLEGAKTGVITGIAFGVTMKRQRFFTNSAGFCHRNPTFARGVVAALDDELAQMVHRRDPSPIR